MELLDDDNATLLAADGSAATLVKIPVTIADDEHYQITFAPSSLEVRKDNQSPQPVRFSIRTTSTDANNINPLPLEPGVEIALNLIGTLDGNNRPFSDLIMASTRIVFTPTINDIDVDFAYSGREDDVPDLPPFQQFYVDALSLIHI